jgi:hypothetical protein
VVETPKEHEDDVMELVVVMYSAPLESPVPVKVVTRLDAAPAIVLAVWVTDVYPPKSANTKSVSATVFSPETVGMEFVPVQPLAALVGGPAAGSKGDVVSTPDTPNAIPEAAVGAPDRVTVTVSADIADVVVPYHSM